MGPDDFIPGRMKRRGHSRMSGIENHIKTFLILPRRLDEIFSSPCISCEILNRSPEVVPVYAACSLLLSFFFLLHRPLSARPAAPRCEGKFNCLRIIINRFFLFSRGARALPITSLFEAVERDFDGRARTSICPVVNQMSSMDSSAFEI